jgi:hypothetical protein
MATALLGDDLYTTFSRASVRNNIESGVFSVPCQGYMSPVKNITVQFRVSLRSVRSDRVGDLEWCEFSHISEAGSNTSTVTLRVVGGDEKGSLRSETVKYGREFQGTRTRERLVGKGQQHIQKTDPSSRQRGCPTKTTP